MRDTWRPAGIAPLSPIESNGGSPTLQRYGYRYRSLLKLLGDSLSPKPAKMRLRLSEQRSTNTSFLPPPRAISAPTVVDPRPDCDVKDKFFSESETPEILNPKVCARIRPLLPREMKQSIAIQAYDNEICATDPTSGEQHWSKYEQVFDSDASQESVYDALGDPCVQSVKSGVSSCIFAHGQTGTGKTHSIVGASSSFASDSGPSGCGLLPRMAAELLKDSPLHVTVVEIYRDKIRDLLGSPLENRPEIRRHPKYGAYIDNVREVEIHTIAAGMELFNAGFSRRMEAETAMNERSSRGHCVVTLTTRDGTKLCCVDLAGRENDRTTTEKNPERLAELGSINLSLFHLHRVIGAIRQKAPIVPYRNSKLTLLLADCLQTQRIFLLACLSPAASAFEDSMLTLRMALMTCQLPAGKVRKVCRHTQSYSQSLISSSVDSPKPQRQSSLLLPSNGPVLGAEAHILAEDPRPKSQVPAKAPKVYPHPYRTSMSEATTRASVTSTSSVSSRSDISYLLRVQRMSRDKLQWVRPVAR
eukprot:GEMP01034933.1.p1 GENE.GEMP01034933.1~~GEMP01034933.1.p1  ORF type:complete len:547 (+),score=83.21 GEMP01034933.1:53-1642(+)